MIITSNIIFFRDKILPEEEIENWGIDDYDFNSFIKELLSILSNGTNEITPIFELFKSLSITDFFKEQTNQMYDADIIKDIF